MVSCTLLGLQNASEALVPRSRLTQELLRRYSQLGLYSEDLRPLSYLGLLVAVR